MNHYFERFKTTILTQILVLGLYFLLPNQGKNTTVYDRRTFDLLIDADFFIKMRTRISNCSRAILNLYHLIYSVTISCTRYSYPHKSLTTSRWEHKRLIVKDWQCILKNIDANLIVLISSKYKLECYNREWWRWSSYTKKMLNIW